MGIKTVTDALGITKKKPRKKPMNCKRLSIEWLEAQGIKAYNAESMIISPSKPRKDGHGMTKGAFVKNDLMGFADILAVDVGNKRIIAVQSTDYTHVSHHKKAYEAPRLSLRILSWLHCGGRFEIHAWEKDTKELRRFICEIIPAEELVEGSGIDTGFGWRVIQHMNSEDEL